MEIASKSLHHSNIVFVFADNKFVMPDNAAILSLYKGSAAGGANFADDVTLRAKVLDLPRLKLQISVEPNRLRIDDNSQQEAGNPLLVKEAVATCRQLFPGTPIAGFGFNFDIYYQFREVVLIRDFFTRLLEPSAIAQANLLDVGVQFTLEKEEGQRRETYFLKVTAPLELAVHVNQHFFRAQILEPSELQKLLETCYREIDDVVKDLKF